MSIDEAAATVDNITGQGVVCYAPMMIATNGIWQGDNPFDYSLPLFILQIILVVVTTRVLIIALKPLRQPRVVAEILGGIILGPSVLGQSSKFTDTVFPERSMMILETMANIGLLYFLFLVGVETDINMIKRTGRKALSIAVASMILPFLTGIVFAFSLYKSTDYVELGNLIIFLGVVLSVTAFPVLARILAELKLLNTGIGRIAMSSALISDICGWVLLAFSIALVETEATSFAFVCVIISSSVFVGFCIFAVRPILVKLLRKIPEGETISDFYICMVLTGVMVCGFITDAAGTHAVFGAFVFGLIIPNGPLSVALTERIEDLVSGLLLPLFFAISGLKMNIFLIHSTKTWVIIHLMIVLACAGRILGTIVVCLFHKIPFHDGIILGFIMNAKGLVEMIILNVGKDLQVLDDESYAIMMIVIIVMTSIIAPAVTNIHKPARKSKPYKRRTIQATRPGNDFRVLVCVHTPRNVPTVINLLEASNPTKMSPISAHVLHLVQLTGRTSAMLIVHSTQDSGRPAADGTQAPSDYIIRAFENFEQHAGFVSVRTLTAVSPYSTMHEDICMVGEDSRVALVIVPFHKQQTVDGGMAETNPAFQTINRNVLANAPCSVGILVDRGLSGSSTGSVHAEQHVAILFFGGPDDREALAYGLRMSERPGIHLTVMRFVANEDESRSNDRGNELINVETTNYDMEKKLDEEFLSEFKARTATVSSVLYTEMVVNHGAETVAAIRSINALHDLFIVGRKQSVAASPLTAGLTDWSECPELGGIGDLLASSDFAAPYSVLVVQQYVRKAGSGNAATDVPEEEEEEEVQYEQMELGHERPSLRGQPPVFSPHFENLN